MAVDYLPIQTGTRLYVCETHYRFGHWEQDGLTKTGKPKWRFVGHDDIAVFNPPPSFRVSRDSELPCRPQWYRRLGRFMFARHARITLRVTGVKVERLQDIIEEDAAAEGWNGPLTELGYPTSKPVQWFSSLWNSIHPPKIINDDGEHVPNPSAWDANPWVAAYSFERVKP